MQRREVMQRELGKVGSFGQVTVEYTTVLVLFLLTGLAMLMLVSVFCDYGYRILSLVGLDYP